CSGTRSPSSPPSRKDSAQLYACSTTARAGKATTRRIRCSRTSTHLHWRLRANGRSIAHHPGSRALAWLAADGRRFARVDRERRGGVGRLARTSTRDFGRRMARAGEARRASTDSIEVPGGFGGGALLRLDRRPSPSPRRRQLPTALHPATEAKR